MSYQSCIDTIKRVAGDISDDDLADVLEELQRRQRMKAAAGLADSMEEAARQAAEDLARDIRMAAIIEKRNAAINERIRLQNQGFIRNEFRDNPIEGFKALLVGSNRVRAGARASAQAQQKQLLGNYLAGMVADLEKGGLMRGLSSGELDRDIARALWTIDNPNAPAFRGPREAMEIAKTVNKYQELARLDANQAGASIGKIEGYIVRQSHDMAKLERAGFEAWRDSILPKLDMKRTINDLSAGEEDVMSFLKNAYDGLVSGVHVKTQPQPSGFKGPANLAKKVSQERVLHFKDADAWFDYNAQFGTGNIREAMLHGLERSAQNTGLMRVMGTNPGAMLDRLFTEARDGMRSDPVAARKMSEKRGTVDNWLAELDGSTRIPGSHMGAQVSANLRAIQSLAKLGGAVISSITDVPVYASEMSYQGRSFLGSMGEAMGSLLRGRGSAEQRQIVASAGVFFENAAGNIAARFSAHDTLGGQMSKLQRLFFKMNGLTWWTDTLRSSSVLSMSHHLHNIKGQGWDAMGPEMNRVLSLYGIDSGLWDVMRQGGSKLADGRGYLTPDSLADVSDDVFRKYLQDKGSPTSDSAVASLRREAEGKLRAYFVDRAETAVLQPGAETRAFIFRGSRPGTVPGEILRFIGQFKQFSIGFLQKVAGREIYGRGADSLGEALRNGNGEMQGLAQLMVWTTVFGYGAMTAKDLLKGKTPRSLMQGDEKGGGLIPFIDIPGINESTFVASFLQGGGAGIFGDFLFGDMRNRFGGGILSSIAGPVLGGIESIFDLWSKVREGDDAGASAFRTIINNTPFLNLFYTRTALDYLLLYRIQEWMNPGYLRRLERRTQQENAQTFLLSPSEVAR